MNNFLSIGHDNLGNPVFLSDIWPSRSELQEIERQYVLPAMFKETYSKITEGNKNWNDLLTSDDQLYPWDPLSTYVKSPPFFDKMNLDIPPIQPITNSRVLLFLGDSVTTGIFYYLHHMSYLSSFADHISPAGSISRNSPAARYLGSKGYS